MIQRSSNYGALLVANTPYISILIILFLLPFVQSVCYIREVALCYFCKIVPLEAEGLKREKKKGRG